MFRSRDRVKVLQLFFLSLIFFYISNYRSLELGRFTIAHDLDGGSINETKAKPGYSNNESSEIKSDTILLDGCGDPVTSKSSNEPYEYCSDEHRRAVEFCTNNTNNQVLMREGLKQPRIKSWGQVRPYSIANISHGNRLPRCNNLDEFLTAIKLGQRWWSSPEQSGKDTIPSTFVPYGCYAPILPPSANQTCDILNQYDHFIVHGDSLARQLRQAIYMSMRGEYIENHEVQTSNSELCRCDGHFSESKTCRTFESYFDETIKVSREVGLCPGTTFTFGKRSNAPWLPKRGKVDPGESIDWDQIDCTDKNYRGALLVAQGGLHWKMNSTDTFESLVHPIITHQKFEECLCLGKVRLIWLAMNAQSTALDDSYPHQSRDNALIFNTEMRELFISSGMTLGQDVVILDWWNLTKDAQSSDGLHYLSDVNLAKAAQLIHLAKIWPAANDANFTEALIRPRSFVNKRGDNITLPPGAPLPPFSFYREQGVHLKCTSS